MIQLENAPAITGIGGFLGENKLTNDQLIALTGITSSDAAIQRLTGIEGRHWANKNTYASDMGEVAARQALRMAEISPSDLAAIAVATSTPDYLGPMTGTEIHKRLGAARNCRTVELGAACAGGIMALRDAASELIMNPGAQAALAVGSEKMSDRTSLERNVVILFGDGAGAGVLERRSFAEAPKFAHSTVPDREAIYAPAGGAVNPGNGRDDPDRRVRMNGPVVGKYAKTLMPEVLRDVAKQDGALSPQGEIDWSRYNLFVPHQANGRLIEALWEELKVPENRRVMTVNEQGNTSSASVFLALQAAHERGQLTKHDRVLMTSVGAGMVAAACAIDVALPQYS